MPRDFQKGDNYTLYKLMTGAFTSPVFTGGVVSAISDLSVDLGTADVSFPERGFSTGHMHGQFDPKFSFTLMINKGDANSTALQNAIRDGSMITLAVGDGPLEAPISASRRYMMMECVLFGQQISVKRGDPATYEVTAMRHANSDNDIKFVPDPLT